MHLDTRTYRDHVIDIHTDDHPCNPCEEWDMFGQMICFHGRFNLGHPHDFYDPDDLLEYLKDTRPPVLLPLYAYEHGGIILSTGPYSCLFDAGQAGFAYSTRAQILENWNCRRITRTIRQWAEDLLRGEIATYNDYFTGNVHGYIVKHRDDEEISSCRGFYGEPDECCPQFRFGLLCGFLSVLIMQESGDDRAFLRKRDGFNAPLLVILAHMGYLCDTLLRIKTIMRAPRCAAVHLPDGYDG